MSDEKEQTYSAREIVLEFFPATSKRFIPEHLNYQVTNSSGQYILINRNDQILLKLEPVAPAGNATVVLCCDFCHHSSTRQYLQMFRAEKPDSNGRHFLYICLCRNTEACEVRRLNDEPVEKLLARVGVKQ